MKLGGKVRLLLQYVRALKRKSEGGHERIKELKRLILICKRKTAPETVPARTSTSVLEDILADADMVGDVEENTLGTSVPI